MNKFSRFTFVGIFNTLLGYSLTMLLLRYSEFPYYYSIAMVTLVSVIINFFMHKKFVFRSYISFKIFLMYLITYGFIYLLNILLLAILIGFGLESYIGFTLIFPFSVLFTYFLLTKFVFIK